MAHLEVLVPHDVNILPYEGERRDYASDVARLGLPRAEEHPRQVGVAGIHTETGRLAFDLYEITYGKLMNMPPYDSDAYYVVSKPTIAAALRDPSIDRTFTDRLLFPYAPIRDPDTNQFLGVRGLARPIPTKRYVPDGIGVPPLTSFEADTEAIRNTCPYPFKLYDRDAPAHVPAAYPTVQSWQAAAPGTALSVRYAPAEQHDRLSDQLGVPVYETEVTGAHNDTTDTERDMWRLCHIDVPPALRSVAGALTMLDIVRLNGSQASVLGGKSLARLAPHHYDEPII